MADKIEVVDLTEKAKHLGDMCRELAQRLELTHLEQRALALKCADMLELIAQQISSLKSSNLSPKKL